MTGTLESEPSLRTPPPPPPRFPDFGDEPREGGGSRPIRGWLGGAALVALLLALLGLAQTAPGRSLLERAGLASHPERFAELAFTHPLQLPDRLANGSGTVSAPAAVHNMEGTARTYRWTASEQLQNGRTIQLDSGSVAVQSGRWGSLAPRLAVRCGGNGRVHVMLRIDSPPRSIGFWLDCPSGGGAP